MLAPWRKTTSLIAFFFFLLVPVALAGPGAFGVAAFPVCQPRGIHLSWSSSSGAASYKVFRAGQAISGTLPASTLAFNDTTSGTAYTVVATDSRGFTFTSNSVTPAAPNSSFCLNGDLQVAESAYCGVSGPAVHLAWTAGTDSNYFITDANGDLVAVVDGTKSSFDITGLTGGKSVRYAVNNVDANNGQFVTTPSCSGPPGGSTLSATTTCVNNAVSVQLSWTGSSGVAQYRVDRDGVVLTTTTSRTYADTTVTAGHAYNYTISALNNSGSTESNTLAVTAATCVAPPGAFAASATAFCTTGASPAPAVHVTWTASSNAASYVVNRNGTAYTSSLSSSTLALDDLNVTVGQTYAYTVTATNSGGSTVSSGQSVTITNAICPATPPTQPVLSESTVCNGTSPLNHLSWTASANAASYIIFRSGTSLVSLPSSTLVYDDTSAVPGQTYAYFVRASNGGGTADSNTINISLPTTICQPPPGNLALTAKAICDTTSSPAAAIRLTWTASANTTSYAVFRAGEKIGDQTTTSFVDTANIVAGQSYKYFVRASGPGGTTDSDELNVTVDVAVCQSSCSFACAATVITSAAEQFPVRFALQQQTSCEEVAAIWSFGDGTSSTELAPVHAYASPGVYRWTVTAGSAASAACQNSGTITITAVPPPSKRRAIRH
jgi:hypothetical protein